MKISHSQRRLRVATFAPRQIGDTLMATPLYQALRYHFSDAHFVLLSEIIPQPVLTGLDIFDDVVLYSPNMDLNDGYDLVVLPVFCGDLTVRAHFNRYKHVISLERLHAKERESFRNRLLGTYLHLLFYKHQVEMNMDLARLAGYKGQPPALYCPQGDPKLFKHLKGYIGLFINTPVNDFQALPSRLWPSKHWKALIGLLGSRRAVLVGGPSDETNIAELASEAGIAFEVAPSPTHFTALCRNFDVLVTTDSGGMHLAATTGVSIVSLHGTSSPVLLHPWIYPDGRCVAVLSPNTCSPCQRSYRWRLAEELGRQEMTCMRDLLPDDVVRAIEKIKSLAPGTCMILKGRRLLTKEGYLNDFRRQILWAAIYNGSRLIRKVRSVVNCR